MSELTYDLLHDLFYYDGVNLIWKVRPANRIKVGDIAGCYSNSGYLQVGINQRIYLVHRIIWFMHYGCWPNEIDHINGVKGDNRIENLREVDRQTNNKNRRMPSNNTSGVTGVSFDAKRNKWVAQIRIDGKQKNLGNFDSIEEAERVVIKAHAENGFTPRHGESNAIITLYSNNEIDVVWDSLTGKIRVKPDGDWIYPEMYYKSAPDDD